MIDKSYKIVYVLFLTESVLILLGISFDLITYGREIQTPVMMCAIALGVFIGTIVRLVLRKVDSQFKQVVALTFSTVMIFLCCYYLVEDQFGIL